MSRELLAKKIVKYNALILLGGIIVGMILFQWPLIYFVLFSMYFSILLLIIEMYINIQHNIDSIKTKSFSTTGDTQRDPFYNNTTELDIQKNIYLSLDQLVNYIRDFKRTFDSFASSQKPIKKRNK